MNDQWWSFEDLPEARFFGHWSQVGKYLGLWENTGVLVSLCVCVWVGCRYVWTGIDGIQLYIKELVLFFSESSNNFPITVCFCHNHQMFWWIRMVRRFLYWQLFSLAYLYIPNSLRLALNLEKHFTYLKDPMTMKWVVWFPCTMLMSSLAL